MICFSRSHLSAQDGGTVTESIPAPGRVSDEALAREVADVKQRNVPEWDEEFLFEITPGLCPKAA
jgi:hypothetical protein